MSKSRPRWGNEIIGEKRVVTVVLTTVHYVFQHVGVSLEQKGVLAKPENSKYKTAKVTEYNKVCSCHSENKC